MSFTLTSTTESQPALNAGAAAGDSWKTPPPQAEKPRDPGDVPADIPQKLFNEIREEQIAEKKKAGPALFEGEERGKKDVESPIRNYEAAKQRDYAAERHKAELRAILERVSGERDSGESQSQSESRPGAEHQNGNDEYAQAWAAAAKEYPDFEETLEAAGVGMSPELEKQIRAIGTTGAAAREIAHTAYFLAKNPKLARELAKDPSGLAQISPTIRHQTLLNTYREQLKADPDAARAVAATNVMISKAVEHAILEQDNRHKVAEHLAKNPEEAEELNNLPPLAAIARVSKISAQLEAKAEAKQRSRPPAPISPLYNSGSRTSLPLDQLPPREFNKIRNAQEREYKKRWR